MKPRQILIADDHPIFRRGLKDIVLLELPDALVEEAENAEQALDMVRKRNWDLLLLDINMPGKSGLEILSDLKAAQPSLPVLILSAASEEQYGLRVLKAGASGYITKLRAPHEIAGAIRQILEGGVYLSASLTTKLASQYSSKSPELPVQRLSVRELEVLRRIGAGKGTKEIAAELSLSAPTVSTYRTRIMEKLGIKTTAELIRYAIENKMVDP